MLGMRLPRARSLERRGTATTEDSIVSIGETRARNGKEECDCGSLSARANILSRESRDGVVDPRRGALSVNPTARGPGMVPRHRHRRNLMLGALHLVISICW